MPTQALAPTSSRLQHRAHVAPLLDADDERTLLKRAKRGDHAALGRLAEAHLRLVASIAREYTRHVDSLDDLMSEGYVGLLVAAQRFDATKGARFATYASWWIRAYVRNYTLRNRRLVGMPSTRGARRVLAKLRDTEQRLANETGATPRLDDVAKALGVDVDEVARVDRALSGRDVSLDAEEVPTGAFVCAAPSPEEATAEQEESAHRERHVRVALRALDERERTIVEQHLLADEPKTLARIGHDLGLSSERVRQIEARACTKLRSALTHCTM